MYSCRRLRIMKVIIAFRGNEIPVYLEKAQHKKAVHKLAEILQQKLLHSKQLVRRFLDSLDSIEIIGGDAILYSKNGVDTLALSLY
jgi:hypothetical protein